MTPKKIWVRAQSMDYGSSVWDAPGVVLQEELESVQKWGCQICDR